MGKLNAVEELEAVIEGVTRAWDFHLAQHPISTSEVIEGAIKEAFRQWLEANKTEVLASVAERFSRVTPTELKAKLTVSDIKNGLINRNALRGDMGELQKRLVSFVCQFEWVFDGEWKDYTMGNICDPGFIRSDGTFLNPQVDDESNNWANRGSLLSAYRSLAEAMRQLGWPVGIAEEEAVGDSQ
jgi:hypothetical protein